MTGFCAGNVGSGVVGVCSSAVEMRVLATGSYFLSEEDALMTESEKEGKYKLFGLEQRQLK